MRGDLFIMSRKQLFITISPNQNSPKTIFGSCAIPLESAKENAHYPFPSQTIENVYSQKESDGAPLWLFFWGIPSLFDLKKGLNIYNFVGFLPKDYFLIRKITKT
jgi:hypothetical protein